MEKVSVENKVNKYYIIIGSISMVIIGILLIFSIRENTKQYLVQKGTLDYTEITTGYLVKKEKTVEKDQTKVLVPVVSEGTKVSKGDIIATYKGEEYKNYEDTLADMDKEILERMQELPIVYSSEVDAIESNIYTLVKESIGETSYNKMQEYKQKINTNINKRASIIGELSPTGAEIKTLITKRNNYEAEAKKSNDNILSPMTGIVTYSTDSLETKLSYNALDKLSYNSIKDMVTKEKQTDNTKLKVVNNYEAYIVVKAKLENEEYISKGSDYRLRLIDQENYEVLGEIEKFNILEDGIEVYFKITNGIEHIVDLREIEVEIIWDYANGLIIPSEALNKYDNIDAYYVSVIEYNEYVNIPVIVRIRNDNYVLVKNYSEEQLEELNIESKEQIKLYDRIVIK